ncbi:MAG: hypothetical protein HYR88_05590, partial [Verrucomicrobia bacterium]|nr:hypothetical protein [Verrucomicrobiota bacterium]
MKTFAMALASIALAATGQAQTSIDWFTLDAGGGAQSSANYLVNFTVGQADVGTASLSSPNYRIIPGFWALEDLGPEIALPELSIALNGDDVILSWPSPSTGFLLQDVGSFDSDPPPWGNTAGAVADNGVIRSVTIPHHNA